MSAVSIKSSMSGNFKRSLRIGPIAGALGLGTVGAAVYYYYNSNNNSNPNNKNNGYKMLAAGAGFPIASIPQNKTAEDYQDVYNSIAKKVWEQDDRDEGSGRFGLLTRLAWHTSGTYDKNKKSGGSYGGSMIYDPESSDPENAGLEVGRDFLAEFKEVYPWISRGDLWTLGGVVGVQESGGPKIKWRPGRTDYTDRSKVPENGNLPDASKDGKYVKNLFARMGFDERETVALIGAHCLGRCHPHYSGYDGPWGPSSNMFTNDFFVRLLQKWHVKKWNGKKQYEDDETNSFMMLPTDMALKEESYFLKYVKMYAEDQDLFFKDFSNAFTKLLENGIEFKGAKHIEFKTLDEQE